MAKLESSIRIRISTKDKEALGKIADVQGLSLSSWARQLLKKTLKNKQQNG